MTDSPIKAIDEGLASLGTRFRGAFAKAATEQALRTEHAQVLGKKGELTAVLALMRNVPAADRPAAGAKVNAFKDDVEAAFATRLRAIARAAREAELRGRRFDLTLPGRLDAGRGHPHPVLQVRDDLLAIFRDLGFVVAEGREVDLEDRLRSYPDHGAMDEQGGFSVQALTPGDGGPVASREGAPRVVLRTRMSNVQVREMTGRTPPMAVVTAGQVYRRDDDPARSPMLHRIEGFLVGEGVSVAELKGVLTAFAERLHGAGTVVRFRPSAFPSTEPGLDLDVGCVFCRRAGGSSGGCRACKQTGWLGVLGCGMIHPDVFRRTGIDPETYSGFAFGLGIERVAMLRYGIPDTRLLFDNDPRFLEQF